MNDWIENNKGLIFALLSIVTLAGGFTVYSRQPEPPPLAIATASPTVMLTPTSLPEPTATATPSPIRVFVAGEVHQPDVYLLPPGSIIKDAILAAGGMTANASQFALNLSQEVLDQQQITVPAASHDLPTPPPVRGGVPPSNANPQRSPALIPLDGGKIDLNDAPLEQLVTLNGIGPSIGQSIIDYREQNGPFQAIEDILNVSGIGPKTFEKIKNHITVGP